MSFNMSVCFNGKKLCWREVPPWASPTKLLQMWFYGTSLRLSLFDQWGFPQECWIQHSWCGFSTDNFTSHWLYHGGENKIVWLTFQRRELTTALSHLIFRYCYGYNMSFARYWWKFWVVACKLWVHSYLSDLLFWIGYFWWHCLSFFSLLCKTANHLDFQRGSEGEDWRPAWEGDVLFFWQLVAMTVLWIFTSWGHWAAFVLVQVSRVLWD